MIRLSVNWQSLGLGMRVTWQFADQCAQSCGHGHWTFAIVVGPFLVEISG